MQLGGEEGALASEDLLQEATVFVVAVWGVGTTARQLIVFQARDGVELDGAAALGEGRYAVGEPSLVARAVGLSATPEDSLLEDVALLRLRAQVMPEGAESAAVRAVARLDFDARVEVASKFGMSEAPISLALWGDVVDDMAIVAQVTGESEESHERLQRAILLLRKRIANKAYVKFLGLSAPLQQARVTRMGATVQVVLVLSPKRLALVVERLATQLRGARPSEPSPKSEVPLQPSASHD